MDIVSIGNSIPDLIINNTNDKIDLIITRIDEDPTIIVTNNAPIIELVLDAYIA